MNWRLILVVYLKELKDSLRDRRTLISTIVIPTLAMPLLFLGAGAVVSKTVTEAKNEPTSIMIIGGQDSPKTIAAIQAEPRFRVVETQDDFKELISQKKVRVAVGIPQSFDVALAEGKPEVVTLYHYEGELKSRMGASDVEAFFRSLREKTVAQRLESQGLPKEFVKPFELRHENVAPPKQVGGNTFGGIVPYIMILLCFTGAMYPGIDLTAGEKERGTMETLMCSPVKRINIVLGKFLLVVTASVATIVFSVLSMGGSLLLVGFPLLGRRALAGETTEFAAPIDPLGIPGVLALIAPLAVLFASVILAVALTAKSYKEAQSYVSPMVLVVVLPAMFGILPGIELDAKTALIPILNITLACKEMLSGIWHWHYIALIFLSSCAYAGIALLFCVRMFNREEVIFRA